MFALDGDLFIVVHLMIAGRFRWRERGAAIPGKVGLAAFDFPAGTAHPDRGRIEAAGVDPPRARRGRSPRTIPAGSKCSTPTSTSFAAALTRDNHTLKRALTDPHIFSGIGNAYSDEILHAAQLSPMKMTCVARATRRSTRCSRRRATTLLDLDRPAARARPASEFPEKVTAFRKEMAVHGKLRQALPGLRRAGPAHRLRDERGELLQPVPDRRAAAVGSGVVAAAQGGLAAHARGAGVQQGRAAA